MDSDALLARIEQLESLVKGLQAKVTRLERENLKLRKENAQLKRRLLAYENAHTPSSKSRKKREPKEPGGRLGAPEGHEKYEREQPEPTQTVEHKQELCSRCGNKLGKPAMTERRVIEEIPEPRPIEVTEHLIHHYVCECCGKENVAQHNLPKGCFGHNVRTHVTLLRYEDRLPLKRIVRSLERHYNIRLTDVAALNITRRVAEAMQPEYERLISLIRASKAIYADETEIKVNGRTYWIWVFAGEHSIVYVIRPSRSKRVAEEILGRDYAGVVVSDGYSAYSKYKYRQRCWAHIMREAEQILRDYPGFGIFYKMLRRMFMKVRRIRDSPPPLQERLRLREELERRMQSLIDTLESHRPFRKFAGTLRNGLGAWFSCIEHLFVEPTNNTAERALRELIVQRKIIGGLRAEHGAETMGIVNTMLATWRMQGMPCFQSLKNAISR